MLRIVVKRAQRQCQLVLLKSARKGQRLRLHTQQQQQEQQQHQQEQPQQQQEQPQQQEQQQQQQQQYELKGLQRYEQMRELKQRTHDHIAKLVAAGQWREALDSLDAVPWEEIPSTQRVHVYHGALLAFHRRQQWRLSMQVIEKALKHGNAVDEHMYILLLTTLAACRQGTAAVAMLHQMQLQGLTPKHQCYSWALLACKASHQWEQGLALLQQMHSRTGLLPSAICYTHIISACGECGQWQQALQLLHDLQTSGVRVKPVHAAAACTAAIEACSVSGQWQHALQILNDMAQTGVPVEAPTCLAVISACAYSGEWQRAVELLSKVPVSDATAALRCHNAAMTACGVAGQHSAALQLFKQLHAAGVAEPASTRMYTAAITACAAAGQWAHALNLLQQYAEEQELPVTLGTSTADGDSSSSSSEQRRLALELMQHLRAQGCCIYIDRAGYYTAIVAMSASGEVHKADAVYRRLLTAGLVHPWSTEEIGTLDVSSLHITAVAEAAIRTVLHDMCNYTSVTAAAVTAVECSSGEQYYVHDAARDLHIITRQQQCSSTIDTTGSTDDHADSSDGESDTDDCNSSMLQLCVTELLEQVNVVFSVDDTGDRVRVPADCLQQHIARTIGVATG
jgi:pentatricopeptide repeat protein